MGAAIEVLQDGAVVWLAFGGPFVEAGERGRMDARGIAAMFGMIEEADEHEDGRWTFKVRTDG